MVMMRFAMSARGGAQEVRRRSSPVATWWRRAIIIISLQGALLHDLQQQNTLLPIAYSHSSQTYPRILG